MLKDNIYYFNYSCANPEPFLDDYYAFYKSLEDKKKNLYFRNIKNIESILEKVRISGKEKYYSDLLKFLSRAGAKYSGFAAFCSASDANLASILKHKDKNPAEVFNLIKKLVKYYFEYRENELFSKNIIQLITDLEASKKKGKIGENKIIKESKLKQVKTLNEFLESNQSVAKINKNGEFSFNKIKKILGIKFHFGKQNKSPDCILKKSGHIFIIEAKHIHTSGGSQNKQIEELISFIKLKENLKNFHYLSFLDGRYFEKICETSKGNNKISIQRKEILEKLKNNQNNFFVNTKGLLKILNDL